VIAFLQGRVVQRTSGHCVLEVHGVGYRLAMTTVSLAALPAEGDEVLVHTYLHVREDELSLFGFENEAEKTAFEQLITVSGVGPKVALATLSTLSSDALAKAIASEDVAVISSVPGIGKKTAQRIILDLADKLGTAEADAVRRGGSQTGSAIGEASDALLAMGFSPAEASAALKDVPGDESDAQAVLKLALRRLGGAR
jgi:Holliday junction DNA helicase RuvA